MTARDPLIKARGGSRATSAAASSAKQLDPHRLRVFHRLFRRLRFVQNERQLIRRAGSILAVGRSAKQARRSRPAAPPPALSAPPSCIPRSRASTCTPESIPVPGVTICARFHSREPVENAELPRGVRILRAGRNRQAEASVKRSAVLGVGPADGHLRKRPTCRRSATLSDPGR